MLLTESVSSTVLSGVSFTTFRAEDVKRLSVKEITNAQTFDALGHVTSSGLHDPALGPAEMEDVCATCGQNGIHCPGHMGHITFPLPVYNPLFFRTLYTVLKATCFSCHRFLAQSERIIIAINQHKLLEYGLLEKADHLVQTCAAYLCEQDPKRTSMKSEESEERKKPSVESNQAVVSGLMKLIDQLVKDALKDVDKKRAVKASLLKNLIDIREQLRKEIQVMALVQLPRHCVHCQALRRPLRNEYNSKIFFTHKAPADERRKKRRAARDIGETYEADAADEVETVVGDNDDDDDDDSDHDDDDDDDERGVAAKKKATPATERQKLLSNLKEQVYLTPLQAREHLRALWEFDECRQVLQQIFGALSQKCAGCPTDVFFLEVMPVPPTRFRPVQMLKGGKYENMQTANLSKALKSAQAVCDVINYMQKERENLGQTGEREGIPVQIAAIPGQTNTEKLHNSWIRLQTSVNGIVDSSLDKLSQKKHPGIKQLLEKKEGLFRKHMMGKRVDYAARSVISPDPYINMDEVGIPEVFATKLTYPEPVTPRNAAELSRAVINGPDVHPGASFIEQEDGTKIKLSNKSRVQREAMAKQLLKPTDASKCVLGRKKVYRHLRNGDVLLLNRQPTLHRPSIQAHKARVLRGEKTLRLHYANCKAYNADFDGDEMNAHFPQNEVARAEAYYIVNTAHSYLVPKDGTPLAGLIQDHVIAGVLLSIRGRFFLRSDYQHLVYSGLTENHNPIKLLPPAIRKPHVLWSGKQVISTVLLNLIPKNKPPLNLVGKAKIGAKSWISTANPRPWAPGGKPLEPDELSESAVIFRDGELLCGVLDKAHYGPTPYGLVHCCYEIYGPDMASKLLTSLARVFTTFLQLRGFTLGVEDILVTKKADKKRRRIAEASTLCGPDVAARAFGLSEKPKTSKVEHKFRLAQFNKEEGPLKELDLCMKSRTDEFQNEIAKACMPYGLHKSFPSNNLQLMVQSGAKGSSVNTMQISCLLGQIELEGRRPPLMCTGRALPSFLAYDTSPRSGGFISGRFLTGIRPQEYFFHCMAGREGLVDTAVKTSRSGYLQRCIIKHLEGLLVAYDLTVRDSDGSVVQFQYGEDSLDILNTPFLTSKQIPFLVRNHGCLMADGDVEKLEKVLDTTSVKKPKRKTMKYVRKYGGEQRPRDSPFLKFCEDVSVAPSSGVSEHGRLPAAVDALKKWRTLDDSDKSKYKKRVVPEPVTSRYRPDRYLGSMSENHQKMVDEYAKSEANLLLGKHEDMTPSKSRDHISRARYDWLMNVKHMRALVEPGQAVGLLAAQSIGEPSTQMTLNTFHFAGRGEMNVTLGIPRLREILMTASQTLKTPAMEVPVLPEAKSKRVKQLQLKLTSVTLDKVLAKTLVTETTIIRGSAKHRLYRIRLEYLPYEQYKDKYILTPEKINKYVERKFLRRLDESVRKLLTGMNVKKSLYSSKVVTRVAVADELAEAEMAGDQADLEDEIDDDDQNDGDTTADKNRRRQQDDVDYEGEEEERGEVGAQSASESESNDFDSDEAEEDDDDDEEAEDEEEDDLNMSVREKKKKRKSLVAMDGIRVNAALQSCSLAVKYEYDAEEELWAEVTLELPLTSGSKFDMTTVLEIVARRAVVWETSQIKRCFLSQNKMAVDQTTILKTEGVNLQELHRHDKLLDLKQIHSNDVHAIANVYGIEAAARAIVKELRTVFAAYGIDVNYRHLSLIADYMTFEGHYKPFNRMAMESNASPLQKMTFETAMHFIKTATISGAQDNLQSPSSRLVVGQPVYSGTGCFDLIQPLAQTS